MTAPRPSLAYITAGAGGMFCGSCMHDNTLARAITGLGVDVLLVPTYTPIRTDEENVSIDRVFFGGINIYLEQTIPLYRYLPDFATRLLDRPWLIRWATSRESAVNPQSLGALTVSMLRGSMGNQRREVVKLCDWLAEHVRPDVVVLTNMLIAGCVPPLKQRLGVPVLVTLQGDDVFVDFLPQRPRLQTLQEIRKLVDVVDGFLVHSRYYAEYMQEYFRIPPEKMYVVPLGIDVDGFPTEAIVRETPGRPPAIGYLARLSKEKGLHVLVDAFIELRRRGTQPDVRLHLAGWMGEGHQDYAESQFQKLRDAGLAEAFEYVGSVDRTAKIEFLRGLDLLSVPTVYREPKGLFVLEALAAGVPVVQPAHGAFPELIAATGGGTLVPPEDPIALADELERLLGDPAARAALALTGQRAVHTAFRADGMARGTWQTIRGFLE